VLQAAGSVFTNNCSGPSTRVVRLAATPIGTSSRGRPGDRGRRDSRPGASPLRLST
jgi:hypothetical protein